MYVVTFLANRRLHLPCLVSITVVWEWSQLCQLEYLGPEGPGGIRNTDISIICQLQAHIQDTGRLSISGSNPNLMFFLAKPKSFSMEPSSQIFIFGGQTNSFDRDLRQLLHVKDNVVLRSFFERVTWALRVEIAGLPALKQEPFPRFATFLDLLRRRCKLGSNPALELALLCIAQLACFIR